MHARRCSTFCNAAEHSRQPVSCQCLRTLPVAGSGTAPLRPMVTLGTGFVSDKLVRICKPPTDRSANVGYKWLTCINCNSILHHAAQEQGPHLG